MTNPTYSLSLGPETGSGSLLTRYLDVTLNNFTGLDRMPGFASNNYLHYRGYDYIDDAGGKVHIKNYTDNKVIGLLAPEFVSRDTVIASYYKDGSTEVQIRYNNATLYKEAYRGVVNGLLYIQYESSLGDTLGDIFCTDCEYATADIITAGTIKNLNTFNGWDPSILSDTVVPVMYSRNAADWHCNPFVSSGGLTFIDDHVYAHIGSVDVGFDLPNLFFDVPQHYSGTPTAQESVFGRATVCGVDVHPGFNRQRGYGRLPGQDTWDVWEWGWYTYTDFGVAPSGDLTTWTEMYNNRGHTTPDLETFSIAGSGQVLCVAFTSATYYNEGNKAAAGPSNYVAGSDFRSRAIAIPRTASVSPFCPDMVFPGVMLQIA